MKSIMISIKPKYVAKILNGEKTIEIRKTCPAIFKHLKSYEAASLDVYIYCTKEKPNLWLPYEYDCFELDEASQPYLSDKPIIDIDRKMNGKVVAKFTLRKIKQVSIWDDELETETLTPACLDFLEFDKYTKGQVGYAWHISNLEIFDEPKGLNEFSNCDKYPYTRYIGKAPQSWCYVEVE